MYNSIHTLNKHITALSMSLNVFCAPVDHDIMGGFPLWKVQGSLIFGANFCLGTRGIFAQSQTTRRAEPDLGTSHKCLPSSFSQTKLPKI